MENAITFGTQAQLYSNFRPGYPEELFDWIANKAPAKTMCWDVGTGSGQAAYSLSHQFSNIHATDIDSEQIAAAKARSNIKFLTAPAHDSRLSENTVDAITVGTALHWFDHDKFWKEVERVARPGAIFCAWTYHRIIAEDPVRLSIIDPVLEVIDPYWSEGNRLSWRGYYKDELGMPFQQIEMPEFAGIYEWDLKRLVGFMESWSAHKRARNDGHKERLDEIVTRGILKLGNVTRTFKMPLNTLAARVI